MKKLDKIISREDDFSKWYTSIISNADLISYSEVKGSIILKPYSYSIWDNIKNLLDKEFKSLGIENVYMPLLISKELFNKEKKMIDGFSPECLTVTKVGEKKLEKELIIRPTSEVIFGSYFAKEIQTYNNLPMKLNQWANVFRWEKTTRPFLRTTEFLWQEGHTLHASAEEAKEFSLTMIKLYANFLEKYLSIPVFIGKKTEKEKFAGATNTYTIETLMYDGQALQSGTSHYFDKTFAKNFGVKFLNKQNKFDNPFYTSWGVSTRLIGALIMSHSDDNGLVLPSSIAPIQIQIITLKNSEDLINKAKDIKAKLSNYRVNIDITKKSFGYKRAETEIRGIPLRIEIGNRELENNTVVLARRDNFKKETISLNEIAKKIDNIIKDYDKNLYNIANKNNIKRIKNIETYVEYKNLLKKGNFIALAPFCCNVECENLIKNETQTNSRCIPLENSKTDKNCFKCNKKASHLVYFARAY